MTIKEVDPKIIGKAKVWLEENYDADTRKAVKEMMDNDPAELVECFYRDLEFGTGGLRGIMGVGTNRMNKYTVGAATQGLANYLKKALINESEIRAAIAYDSRNNSGLFAGISAEVLAANGIKVFLFDSLRPTPELSFAVRYLKCHTGIVVTASHNPKEYNGYKVYWSDGGQLVPPHDKNVIAEVQKIESVGDIKFSGHPENIVNIGEDIDKEYISTLVSLSISPDVIKRQSDMKIVYTPIHGTGYKLVPEALKAFGFTNIQTVKEQLTPDGNFPTVVSPNPEEKAALELALKLAKKVNADLILATDPDGDRVGVGVKDNNDNYILLNGNQSASLLIYYLIRQWKIKGKLTGKEFIAKTIVTSELLKDIAISHGVESYDVLTGFKYIAEIIRKFEGQKKFIGGGEESYGYLVGDFVRDKDAVAACALLAETAAWARNMGMSMYEMLINIYQEYGFYLEDLISITKKGKSGAEEIQAMMDGYRNSPPREINSIPVEVIKDYKLQKEFNLITGDEKPIDLPKSDVLQFFLKGGSKITVRPSGTEPKIKFYFGVKGQLPDKSQFDKVNAGMRAQLEEMIAAMKLR
ncbi:phospho-sugar mutase [Lentimicrobium sp.]|jgi:phosphoglucomutase|uniref:phospho-sugar mutase n=1 Tax=Lentimicrobium sp. TaxID=2034841 RepID=UPI0025EFD260|nr:phospho-sugar mutase [Lentimicrobium sp.]MCO5255654.1 phospho-sugar mutase [Lentimicrobium sp.]MCO5261532.1 phospho-sugar mutase [Lentimicrobium sp.]HPF64344.1 phospho-sugar mutase [Lentimicrobium sp.]HPJ61119.1 phospho-sugar mutase [Lentimicrobium sp.]HPR26516.1 phospho-sugar mutase [Lentimicrobium sp.]